MIKTIIKIKGYIKYKFTLIFASKNNYARFKNDFHNNKIEKILAIISKTDIVLDHYTFIYKYISKIQLDNCFNQLLGEIILKRFQLSPFIYFSYSLSLKKLIIPLPYEFLKIFEDNDIKINFLISNIVLRFICILNLLTFFLRCNLRIIKCLNIRPKNLRKSLFVYDDMENKHMDPRYGKNLFEWIKNNFTIEAIESHHLLVKIKENKIFAVNNNYIPYFKFYHVFNLFVFNLYLFISLLLQQFSKKNFLKCLFFEEYFKFFIFLRCEKKYIYKIYLFTTSNMNHKPLWAQYVENKKISSIIFVNYSASYQYNTNKFLQFGVNRQNWPIRYELDKTYIDYLKKNINFDSKYIFDKKIYFTNSNEKIKFKKYIAVFDHLVWNEKFLARSLVENNDFIDAKSAKFLINIIKVSKKLNIKVILKSKRKKWFIKKYHKFLTNLKQKNLNNFDIVYDKSIYEVAKNSEISITYPFTSAAIMSKNYGFKSIYFDYSKKYELTYSDLNYGIKTIFGKKQLEDYLINNKIYNKKDKEDLNLDYSKFNSVEFYEDKDDDFIPSLVNKANNSKSSYKSINLVTNKIKKIIQSVLMNYGYMVVKLDKNYFYDRAMSVMLTKHKLSIKKRSKLENDFLNFCIESYPNSYSQRSQDLFALYVNSKVNDKYKSDFCIEFGAGDGVYLSNTKILSDKNYKSILIEPSIKQFRKLIQNRKKDICLNLLVRDIDDNSDFISFDEAGLFSKKSSLIVQKENKDIFEKNFNHRTFVKTDFLNNIIKNQLPKINHFAYISIDTEGNELEILKTINFKKYTFNCLTVECNFYSSKRESIIEIMNNKGYRSIFDKDVAITGVDLWFYNKNIKL